MGINKHFGFTLIETIVGIVLIAIAFSIMSTWILPATERSASTLHQIRAAELAQSVLNEITAKAFDENSDKSGGNIRCGEGVDNDCTAEVDLGEDDDEGSRSLYDDVDDYNDLDYINDNIEDSQGNVLTAYLGYSMWISVGNDSDLNGITISDGDGNDNVETAKLITVIVETPTGIQLTFSAYRMNF